MQQVERYRSFEPKGKSMAKGKSNKSPDDAAQSTKGSTANTLPSSEKHNETRRAAKKRQKARRGGGGPLPQGSNILEEARADRVAARLLREAENCRELFLLVGNMINKMRWSGPVKDAARDYVAIKLIELDEFGYSNNVVLTENVIVQLNDMFCDAVLATRGADLPRNTPGQLAEWFNEGMVAAHGRRAIRRAAYRAA